jgi:DNA-binding GntR family transcriptional regulator
MQHASVDGGSASRLVTDLNSTALTPVPTGDTRTLHEVVLAELRGAIVSGAFAGGTRLVQTDLALQMGVSATPVREAIRDLVAEGLLEFDR